MKNLKFEKVNMKIVVSIGIAIIVILTAMFIIFRTNLIFDNDDNKNNDKTNEQGNTGNNGDNTGDDGNVDPNNPDNPTNPGNPDDPSGDGNGDNTGDGEDGNGDTGNEIIEDEPDYEDPDDAVVSDDAKKRKKDKEDLTVVEKEYIFQDNINGYIGKPSSVKDECGGEYFCVINVTECNEYKSSKDKITDCTGEIIYKYNEKTKKLEFDMSGVKCE